MQCHISPFKHGGHFNHDATRPRKLLLHKKEIKKYDAAIKQKGYTIIPLKLYFKSGRVKVEIGSRQRARNYTINEPTLLIGTPSEGWIE